MPERPPLADEQEQVVARAREPVRFFALASPRPPVTAGNSCTRLSRVRLRRQWQEQLGQRPRSSSTSQCKDHRRWRWSHRGRCQSDAQRNLRRQSDSSNVSVIDAQTNQLVSTIGVHAKPYFVSVSLGRQASLRRQRRFGECFRDRLGKASVIATIRVGGAPGMAGVSPDGKLVVVEQSRRQLHLHHRCRQAYA